MPIHVHELAPDDFEELLKFSQTLGAAPGADLSAQALAGLVRAQPGLSLVARRDGEIVGAALIDPKGRNRRWYLLLVGPQGEQEGAGKVLLDKAMMKLAARGGRTCRLGSGSPEGPLCWEYARWRDWPELAGEGRRGGGAAAWGEEAEGAKEGVTGASPDEAGSAIGKIEGSALGGAVAVHGATGAL